MVNVEVVIPAKNEQKNLPQVFAALKSQTLPPSRVIFIDDGSTDGSGSYAQQLGYNVIKTFHYPDRERGSPDLAGAFNLGFHGVSDSADYVMILAGDHVLPNNYIEQVLSFMMQRNIAMCSGTIRGESSELPRGSGRVIQVLAWKDVMGGLQYPRAYGFETYLALKLMENGYKVSVLSSLCSETLRRTGKATNQVYYGRGMKWLGYIPAYLIARAMLTAMRYRKPSKAIQMVAGYLTYRYKSDVAQYCAERQKYQLLNYLRSPKKLYCRMLRARRRG
jgi:glycosyltransferase involved in cell wall biosynthesis